MKPRQLWPNIIFMMLLFVSCEEDNTPLEVKNSPPVIINQSFEIEENSANGSLVGTLAAFDLEGDTMNFKIVDATNVPFEIESSTNNLVVKDQTLLDVKTHPQYIFHVKVTDHKDTTLTNTATVTVKVKDQYNGPMLDNQVFEVLENSANGTLIGTISATDKDGDELTYEMLNAEDLPFEIEKITGKIVVKDQSLLNSETQSKYTLLVKVTDNSPASLNNFATVTVVVKNVSEFPLTGIIARYPFNGNARDIGPNGYDGDKVDIALTTDRKGAENSAFRFNGTSSYVKVNSIVGTGVRSISMWFMLDINIDNRNNRPVTLITRDGNPSNRKLFSLCFTPDGWAGEAGKLRFMYTRSTADIYYVQSNSSFWRKDIWHHVVVTIDPVKGMMMYIDNVKQDAVTPFYDATDATDATDEYPLSVYVGNFSPWSYRNFTGKIDDVAIFNRALSEDEIEELYQE